MAKLTTMQCLLCHFNSVLIAKANKLYLNCVTLTQWDSCLQVLPDAQVLPRQPMGQALSKEGCLKAMGLMDIRHHQDCYSKPISLFFFL